MTIEAWTFSAKRAWENIGVKIITVTSGLIIISSVSWFCSRVLVLRGPNEGRLVLHYSLEWGIDMIHEWYFAFVLPAVWLAVTIADWVFAFGAYREDRYLSWTFLSLGSLWCIPWSMVLWHLIRINQ